MCGIVGSWDKSANEQAAVGQNIFKMLQALDNRGPDSAGVALYSQQHDGDLVLRVKLGEHGNGAERGQQIAQRVQQAGSTLGEVSTTAEYLRLVLDTSPFCLVR